MPLQHQKNMRECETIIRECILKVVRDSMPIEKILRAYIDETQEEEIIEEKIEKPESEVEEIVVEQTVDSAPAKEDLAPVAEIVKLQPKVIPKCAETFLSCREFFLCRNLKKKRSVRLCG